MEGKTVRNNTITLITHINSHCHNQPMRTEMTEQVHTQQADRWEGRREGGKNKKAVLTCSHWVRYCHSDKSHYDSPFLLTCGGGRNRAVSPNTKGCSRQQSLQVKHHGTLFKQYFWYHGEKTGEIWRFLVATAGVSVVDVLLFTADLMKCGTPTHRSVLSNTLHCTFRSRKALDILYKLACVAS